MVHEVAHGFAALREGDQTAKMAGRLTLNPLKHIDMFGSIIVPLLLIFSNSGFVFGWAKPVPYNPANFKNRRRGTILVASAGIITNIIIAVAFAIFLRLLPYTPFLSEGVVSMFSGIIFINILLAIFNLVPVPPLDGSRILFGILPARFIKYEYILERYSLFLVVLFVFFGWKFIEPVIFYLFSLLTGISL